MASFNPDAPSFVSSFSALKKSGSSTLTIVPTVVAPPLEQALASMPKPCSMCEWPAVQIGPGGVLPGTIMRLPHLDEVPMNSVARNPAFCDSAPLGEGAGNHPCLVASVSACGHAFCMHITSFGKKGLVEKYGQARLAGEMFEQYLPLQELDTPNTNSNGLVAYQGRRMDGQSYINLDFGYWIELQHLRPWRSGTWLDPTSLQIAKQAYAGQKVRRQRLGYSPAAARIDRRSNSPPTSFQRARGATPPRGSTQSAMIPPSYFQGRCGPSATMGWGYQAPFRGRVDQIWAMPSWGRAAH